MVYEIGVHSKCSAINSTPYRIPLKNLLTTLTYICFVKNKFYFLFYCCEKIRFAVVCHVTIGYFYTFKNSNLLSVNLHYSLIYFYCQSKSKPKKKILAISH